MDYPTRHRFSRPLPRDVLRWSAVLTFLLASNAYAGRGGEPKESPASQARKACLSGDYQTGVDLLSDLFVKTKDPDWIYNQGRCFEQNGKYEEAIQRFEEYLRITRGSTTKDRTPAEEHLTECQAKLARLNPPPLPPPPPPAVAPPVAQAPGVNTRPAQTPATQGRTMRIAGITLASVGLAALTAGVIFNVSANSLANDLNEPTGYDRDKVSRRSNYETLSWVGYGLGSACLVGGTVLYFLGRRDASAGRVALTPSVAPGHAGLNLSGAF